MARKLNSYFVHIGTGKNEKIIAVSKGDYAVFNDSKDTPAYQDVCTNLVEKYSSVSPDELWDIPKP